MSHTSIFGQSWVLGKTDYVHHGKSEENGEGLVSLWVECLNLWPQGCSCLARAEAGVKVGRESLPGLHFLLTVSWSASTWSLPMCSFSGSPEITRLSYQMLHFSSEKSHQMNLFLARVFFFKKSCLFLSVLGLCCCVWAFCIYSEWRLLSSCSAWAPHCSGFSCKPWL